MSKTPLPFRAAAVLACIAGPHASDGHSVVRSRQGTTFHVDTE